jgi:hypothetical protein
MTNPTETARALLWRHGLPEDVIDGALCLHAQELAAVQRKEADDLHQTEPGVVKGLRIGADLIDPACETEPAGVEPATAQTALRERIAQALMGPDAAGTLDSAADEMIDAVLALLPAPIDRAAVLRGEAALIRAHCPDHLDSNSAVGSWMNCHCDVADDMERHAAESAPADTGHDDSETPGAIRAAALRDAVAELKHNALGAIPRLLRMADEAEQPAADPQPVSDEFVQQLANVKVREAATVDPAVCPRCKGDNREAFQLCPSCAKADGRLCCPRCGEDITDYAEDDHVFRTGDERPYCSGECVVAAHRAAAAQQPKEARP